MHLFSGIAPRNVYQSERYMQMIKLMGILFLQNNGYRFNIHCNTVNMSVNVETSMWFIAEVKQSHVCIVLEANSKVNGKGQNLHCTPPKPLADLHIV